MGRLFGTDGARGVANTELTCELAMKIGRAAAFVLTEHTAHRPCIIIGKDTRISSDMLESALIAGICSVGADVSLLGTIPTPAVAYLVRNSGADAGIMISASHNPFEYNGIKIFNSDGYKLSDGIEQEIEAIVLDDARPLPIAEGKALGHCTKDKTAVRRYTNFLALSIAGPLDGLKIAIDCANGAASETAPMLFKSLGADCLILNAEPDGLNINDHCGSTHMQKLSETVVKNRCHAGIAFDGDADRCLAVDEAGEIIDGDKLIAIFSRKLKKLGKLKDNTAIVTKLSNMGFFSFAEQNGIRVKATDVGDRYVLEEMIRGGYSIGGEQSGHIIFLDYVTTGDGQLSALQFLEELRNFEGKASSLAKVMERYPQVMLNIKVANDQKEQVFSNVSIRDAIQSAETAIGKEGRLIVRVSGTEPLIRVMAEGRDFDMINRFALTVADQIKSALS